MLQAHDDGHAEFQLLPEVIDAFYAPVAFDELAQLSNAFEYQKAQIIDVHRIINDKKVTDVLGYFFNGNCKDGNGYSSRQRDEATVFACFELDGAINELTATYWQRCLDQTSLMDYMPQARRSQWRETMNAWREPRYKRGEKPEHDMPEFNLANLRATVDSLLARRAEFLAERVDGIFKALSRTHVTNSPLGFSKRMILSYIYRDFGMLCHEREGYVHDLRLIVAKFMGRDEPERDTTSRILKRAQANRGQWIELDGGAIRVRGYLCGTAHLEVHPEMAWRLNAVLAFLYPSAIPEASRQRPKRAKAAGFASKALFERTLSNAVLGILSAAGTHKYHVKTENWRDAYREVEVPNTISIPFRHRNTSKHLLAEVGTVLAALGGVLTNCAHGGSPYWQFDFPPLDLVATVAALGAIPDTRSYQFYPTPTSLSQELIDWLQIGQGDTCLEPEAGQGGIADLLPRDRTICVEVSRLHCDILRAKGHTVVEGDFLAWNPGTKFSVVAMNPPFSENRWVEHLVHASTMVEEKGRLGAILPISARAKAADLLPDFDIEFSNPVDNAFAGTSISVLMLKAVRRQAA